MAPNKKLYVKRTKPPTLPESDSDSDSPSHSKVDNETLPSFPDLPLEIWVRIISFACKGADKASPRVLSLVNPQFRLATVPLIFKEADVKSLEQAQRFIQVLKKLEGAKSSLKELSIECGFPPFGLRDLKLMKGHISIDDLPSYLKQDPINSLLRQCTSLTALSLSFPSNFLSSNQLVLPCSKTLSILILTCPIWLHQIASLLLELPLVHLELSQIRGDCCSKLPPKSFEKEKTSKRLEVKGGTLSSNHLTWLIEGEIKLQHLEIECAGYEDPRFWKKLGDIAESLVELRLSNKFVAKRGGRDANATNEERRKEESPLVVILKKTKNLESLFLDATLVGSSSPYATEIAEILENVPTLRTLLIPEGLIDQLRNTLSNFTSKEEVMDTSDGDKQGLEEVVVVLGSGKTGGGGRKKGKKGGGNLKELEKVCEGKGIECRVEEGGEKEE